MNFHQSTPPLFWPTPPLFSAFLELEYFPSAPAALTLMWVHRGPPHHILTPLFGELLTLELLRVHIFASRVPAYQYPAGTRQWMHVPSFKTRPSLSKSAN